MVPNQPGHRLGLRRVQPEPRAKPQRHLLAEQAVVAAPALGDVVQQDGDIKRPPRINLAEQGRGERVILRQLAALDRRQQADGADRMLVDRIMMVHVELHLGDDAPEVRHEAAEHAGLVHPAQHQVRALTVGEDLEEEGIGFGVVADLVGQPRRSRRCPHRLGVDFQSLSGGNGEQLDQPHRLLRQKVLVGNREAPAVEAEAVQLGRTAAEGGQREAAALGGHLFVQLRQEQPGQIADRLGLQEVELHEPLDRRLAGSVGIAQRRGDQRLVLEAQSFLGAARRQVQVAADRPEEALRPLEPAIFRRAQQPGLDQAGRAARLMQILSDPDQGLQVPQSALAVLDVRLDDIAAVAHLDVPPIALGELGGDEL